MPPKSVEWSYEDAFVDHGKGRHRTYEEYYGGLRPTVGPHQAEKKWVTRAVEYLHNLSPSSVPSLAQIVSTIVALQGVPRSAAQGAVYVLSAFVAAQIRNSYSQPVQRGQLGARHFQGQARKEAIARALEAHAAPAPAPPGLAPPGPAKDIYYADRQKALLKEERDSLKSSIAGSKYHQKHGTYKERIKYLESQIDAQEEIIKAAQSHIRAEEQKKASAKVSSRWSSADQRRFARDARRRGRLRRIAGLTPGSRFVSRQKSRYSFGKKRTRYNKYR